jgi:hypothetical protein
LEVEVANVDADAQQVIDSFGRMHRASIRSIELAYAFGQIVNEKRNRFTDEEMGEMIDRSESTVQLYHRLYMRYPSKHALIARALQLDTFSVAILAGSVSAQIGYALECKNCHGHDIKKVRKDSLAA